MEEDVMKFNNDGGSNEKGQNGKLIVRVGRKSKITSLS